MLDLQNFDFRSGEAAEKEAIRWSTTKFAHWSYEEEVRVFLALKEKGDSDFYWCPFNEKIQLREVIVGPKSDITRAEVVSALDDQLQNISLIKTRLAFQSYRVVQQRRGDFWRLR